MARERREPRTLLEHLIQQSDRTYEELAEEFSRLDARAAISARHLGRLARGERDLSGSTPATRRALQAMFGRSVEELQRPWASEHPATLPEQRTTLTLPGTGPERNILAMAAQRARQYAMLAAEATTPAAIGQIAEDVQRLALAYPQRPVSEVIGDLAETQDTLFSLLERRQPPDQSRDLHFLAGVTSGLLAKVSHDLADPHAAMLQTRTAVLCAEQAGHPGLQAWLRGMQSLVAYWAGRYAEAVRYAEAGREHATQAGGTTAVWLPISAARAYAALGNAEQAKAAITEAEQSWSRVRPDEMDEMGGICTFNQPRTLYYAADALAWLPDEANTAEEYSTRAVNAYADTHDPAWAFGDQAGSHTDLAIARADQWGHGYGTDAARTLTNYGFMRAPDMGDRPGLAAPHEPGTSCNLRTAVGACHSLGSENLHARGMRQGTSASARDRSRSTPDPVHSREEHCAREGTTEMRHRLTTGTHPPRPRAASDGHHSVGPGGGPATSYAGRRVTTRPSDYSANFANRSSTLVTPGNNSGEGTTMTGFATRSWDGITIPAPGTYLLDQAHKRIGFLARHMMVSPVRGEFGQATARIIVDEDPLGSSVTATIQAASVTTGNADRDAHLSSADFLDVERYPTLEYRSTGIKWQGNDDPIFFWARLRSHRLGRRSEANVPHQSTRTAGRFALTGELTVKGITRPVDLQVEFGGARRDPYGQDIFGFSATAEIDREDYGLVWNVALESGGVLVAKSVRIELAGEAIRQS